MIENEQFRHDYREPQKRRVPRRATQRVVLANTTCRVGQCRVLRFCSPCRAVLSDAAPPAADGGRHGADRRLGQDDYSGFLCLAFQDGKRLFAFELMGIDKNIILSQL